MDDLKGALKDSGMASNQQGHESEPGAPNDEMYLRQAEHLMKRGAYHPAMIYLHQSLSMNPESKVKSKLRIQVCFDRCAFSP